MLIKLTGSKRFCTHTLCTIAENFISYRTLIHSTVCIICGKPGSIKQKATMCLQTSLLQLLTRQLHSRFLWWPLPLLSD